MEAIDVFGRMDLEPRGSAKAEPFGFARLRVRMSGSGQDRNSKGGAKRRPQGIDRH
jgi:hypothetical protein